MDVMQSYSQVTLSLHSQPEMRKLKFLYLENDVDIQVSEIPTIRIDRRLSALKEFDCGQGQVPVSKPPDLDSQELFRRQEVNNQVQPPKIKSLLAQDKLPKMAGVIRVYFFDTRQYREYDKMEIQPTMPVSAFINHIVEDYCTFFLNLTPEWVNYSTFDLKLADHENKHDPVLEPIAFEDQIGPFFGQSLCLLRRFNRNSTLTNFQQVIRDGLDVFELSLPSHNSIKLGVEKNKTFGFLVEKTFKTCNISQSPSDYLLVEYHTFITHKKQTLIKDIQERHFQLLRCKPKIYHDQSQLQCQNNSQKPIQVNIHQAFIRASSCTKLPSSSSLLRRQTIQREDLTVTVQRSFYQCSMTLSIQGLELVERYEQSALSNFFELVCEQEYERRYPLVTLLSAYAEEDCLVLKFMVRKHKVARRYRIDQPKRGLFLNEILRICRVNKKCLTLPENRAK